MRTGWATHNRSNYIIKYTAWYYYHRILLLKTNHLGFLAVKDDDIMYSPMDRLRPHLSSYSFETCLVVISISSKPAIFTIFFSSSTEDAPDTQHECIASSSCISGVSSFMITISQIEIRPPGFNAR